MKAVWLVYALNGEITPLSPSGDMKVSRISYFPLMFVSVVE